MNLDNELPDNAQFHRHLAKVTQLQLEEGGEAVQTYLEQVLCEEFGEDQSSGIRMCRRLWDALNVGFPDNQSLA